MALCGLVGASWPPSPSLSARAAAPRGRGRFSFFRQALLLGRTSAGRAQEMPGFPDALAGCSICSGPHVLKVTVTFLIPLWVLQRSHVEKVLLAAGPGLGDWALSPRPWGCMPNFPSADISWRRRGPPETGLGRPGAPSPGRLGHAQSLSSPHTAPCPRSSALRFPGDSMQSTPSSQNRVHIQLPQWSC